MPDSRAIDGTDLVLNGLGLRSFTVFHVRGYVAGLYLRSRTDDAAAAIAGPWPKLLVIHYLRDATAAQIHDLYVDSSKAYCAGHACGEKSRTDFAKLLGSVRAVKIGDVTEFQMTAGGTDVVFDGQKVGHIDGAQFGTTLLDSDLGSSPPSAELRNGLLGRQTG